MGILQASSPCDATPEKHRESTHPRQNEGQDLGRLQKIPLVSGFSSWLNSRTTGRVPIAQSPGRRSFQTSRESQRKSSRAGLCGCGMPAPIPLTKLLMRIAHCRARPNAWGFQPAGNILVVRFTMWAGPLSRSLCQVPRVVRPKEAPASMHACKRAMRNSC